MSNLEELRKRLYQKGASFKARRKSPRISAVEDSAPPSEWEEEPGEIFFQKKRKKIGGLFWFIVVSAVIILGVIGAAIFYVFWWPSVLYSSQAIDIEIQAPERINGGDKVSIKIIVGNKEDIAVENADLIVEYPPTSRLVEEEFRDGQFRQRRSLGKILSGDKGEAIFEAFVFGEEDSIQSFNITLEYRMEGSSAIFAKERRHDLRIIKSPVGLSLSLPGEVKMGQEVAVRIQYISNSVSDLKNLSIIADYPSGFEFKSASPNPSVDQNQWLVGDFRPGSEGVVTVRGELKGEDAEDKIFNVSAGRRREDDSFDLYGRAAAGTILRRPFLDIYSILVNNSDEPVLKAGDFVNVKIFWKNNLPSAVRNVILEASVSGKTADKSSIRVDNGVVRGEDQKLVWNASTLPRLSLVEPGEEGSVSFRFNVPKILPIFVESDTRFTITIGSRIFAGEVPIGYGGVDIESGLSKEIKISSDLQYARRGLYYSGPFQNTGPIPPRVGQETTYTIVWSVTNSANDVKTAVVSASLPAYVSWKGIVEPSSEKISYDVSSGKLIWDVGDLKAGTGVIRPAREAAFQIGFTPAVNQIGSSPILVFESSVEGEDAFTGIKLGYSRPAVTTQLYGSDPKISQQGGNVVR